VYDVTNRPSFDSISMWLREVETYSTSRDTVKLLVGNKIDKVCECVGQTVSERWSDHTLLYSTLLYSTLLYSTLVLAMIVVVVVVVACGACCDTRRRCCICAIQRHDLH
jgi:hypothetical protein